MLLEERENIIFRLEGKSNGKEINLETADLHELSEYLREIDQFIFADKNIPADRSAFTVKLIDNQGGLGISVSMLRPYAAHVRADLEQAQSEYLDLATPKRAAILAEWQKKAEKRQWSYSVKLPSHPEKPKLAITPLSRFRLPTTAHFMLSEVYLYGEIKEWGGVNQPNIHIETSDYGRVIVDTPAEIILNEPENRVYRKTGILVRAWQDVGTGLLKDGRAEFVEFVQWHPEPMNPDELNQIINLGTQAWQQLETSPSNWVRQRRGKL
jgi:hypothetical protein